MKNNKRLQGTKCRENEKKMRKYVEFHLVLIVDFGKWSRFESVVRYVCSTAKYKKLQKKLSFRVSINYKYHLRFALSLSANPCACYAYLPFILHIIIIIYKCYSILYSNYGPNWRHILSKELGRKKKKLTAHTKKNVL
jgi:hypothetical protein